MVTKRRMRTCLPPVWTFVQLQAQHVGGILDQILIEVVALVDGQGKRLVLHVMVSSCTTSCISVTSP